MKGIFSAASEFIHIDRIQSSLRGGKWVYDENERQRLVEQVKENEEPLMKQIMVGIDVPVSQAAAFRELAALGGIGADWLLDKYDNVALCNQVIDAISKQKSDNLLIGDRGTAARLLLIELSRLTNTKDYIPHILDGARGLHSRWFFARLWVFIDDERVVDYLIGTLDEDQLVLTPHYTPDMWTPKPTTFDPSLTIIAMIGKDIDCHPPDKPDAMPGAGYHARELLLLYGEERGIAALVKYGVSPKLILSAKDLLTGHTKPIEMFENLNASGGQFALLSKYIVQEFETQKFDFNLFYKEIPVLVELGDKEAVNTVVIPKLFDFLAAQRPLLDQPVSEFEKALKQMESCWTTTPFLGALEHRDRRVRLLAVKALEKIGDSSTITAITPLLKDDDRKVQKAAKKAVSMLQR
jgi:hypothetical protein